MSAYKREKTWYVRFRFKGARYGTRSPENSRAGAIAYELVMRQRLARGESPYPQKAKIVTVPTFAEFSIKWHDTYVMNNNSPSERYSKMKALNGRLTPYFGKIRLDKISSQMIEEFKAVCLTRNLKPKTINNYLTIMRTCLRTAREWDIVETIPTFKLLKVPPPPFDFLTEPEEQRLLASTKEEPWHTMILLALKTGLRAGELLALQWSDINLQTRTLTVRHSVFRGTLGPPKSNRNRYIPLSDSAYFALQRQSKPNGFVLRVEKEGLAPIAYNTALKALNRSVESAELRKIGWHTLRHTFASHLAIQGVSLHKIQILLGHSDIRTTMRYAHLSQSSLQEAIQVLDPAPETFAVFGHQVATTPFVEVSKTQKPPVRRFL